MSEQPDTDAVAALEQARRQAAADLAAANAAAAALAETVRQAQQGGQS